MRILIILVRYELDNHVIALKLDNASANNVAIEILRSLVTGYHNELFNQQCVCRIINLIMNSGLKLGKEQIFKIRDVQYLNTKNSCLVLGAYLQAQLCTCV